MSARTRWIALGVALVVVLGLVALYVYKSRASFGTMDVEREPKTWVVQPGETLSLTADEVGPDDVYRCSGKGGVDSTPDPGTSVTNSAGITVEYGEDGIVTVTCEPGPPGNV